MRAGGRAGRSAASVARATAAKFESPVGAKAAVRPAGSLPRDRERSRASASWGGSSTLHGQSPAWQAIAHSAFLLPLVDGQHGTAVSAEAVQGQAEQAHAKSRLPGATSASPAKAASQRTVVRRQ